LPLEVRRPNYLVPKNLYSTWPNSGLIFRIRWPADEKQMRVRTLLALLVRVHRCLKKKSFKTGTVFINLTHVTRVTLTHCISALVMGPIEMLYKISI
jgi:hypothetical protein